MLLTEGDYTYQVVGFERSTFPGSAKIPPCNKAVLTLKVTTAEGTANIKCDLILFSSLEWKISSFFRSIGMKKHGERIVMDWGNIMNKYGRATVGKRKYTAADGTEREVNEIVKFLDYDASKMTYPDIDEIGGEGPWDGKDF